MKLLPTLFALFLAATSISALPSPSPRSLISGRRVDKKYIYSTFHSENENRPNEKTGLDIYVSDDGINFSEYAMNTYTPAEGLIRDPSIIEYWGRYYIVYTTGWYGSTLGIISSEDLINWRYEATINVNSEQFVAAQTWAPVSVEVQVVTRKNLN
jgi:predicted GH43/DUF377 family glycosyl hydrolase